MAKRASSKEHILQILERSGATKVKVAFTDIDGILRGKYVHKEKFASILAGGLSFCNVIFGWDCNDVCYDNVEYTGWHTGYPDAQAHLDLKTFRRVPWDNDVAFFLGDFVDADGGPLPVCPRQVLKGVVAQCRAAGFSPLVGAEYEWFNFRETPQSLHDKKFVDPAPLTPGMFGYSLLRPACNPGFVDSLFTDLTAFGIPLEGLHTETGPGVFEAAIMHGEAMEAADRAVLFKTAVKQLAYRHGIVASFMAKWSSELPGCGGHLHQSLVDRRGTNVFYDAADPLRMSPTFRHYLAGQIQCLPHILPMFAPTVNSYKRLVEGAWAPTHVTWSADNRTAALRVISGSPKATRLETRVGGADINAYLAVAASLASGLYGIRNRLPLNQGPVVGNAYRVQDAPGLPRDLQQSALAMAESPIARELFGDAFVEHFTNSRLWEWRRFSQAVTSWEMQRYFEII